MKKVIALLTIVLISAQAYCQKNKIEIGLETGPSITNLVGKTVINQYNKTRLGYYAGLSLQYNISERFSLRSGIAYELKGFRIDREITF